MLRQLIKKVMHRSQARRFLSSKFVALTASSLVGQRMLRCRRRQRQPYRNRVGVRSVLHVDDAGRRRDGDAAAHGHGVAPVAAVDLEHRHEPVRRQRLRHRVAFGDPRRAKVGPSARAASLPVCDRQGTDDPLSRSCRRKTELIGLMVRQIKQSYRQQVPLHIAPAWPLTVTYKGHVSRIEVRFQQRPDGDVEETIQVDNGNIVVRVGHGIPGAMFQAPFQPRVTWACRPPRFRVVIDRLTLSPVGDRQDGAGARRARGHLRVQRQRGRRAQHPDRRSAVPVAGRRRRVVPGGAQERAEGVHPGLVRQARAPGCQSVATAAAGPSSRAEGGPQQTCNGEHHVGYGRGGGRPTAVRRRRRREGREPERAGHATVGVRDEVADRGTRAQCRRPNPDVARSARAAAAAGTGRPGAGRRLRGSDTRATSVQADSDDRPAGSVTPA